MAAAKRSEAAAVPGCLQTQRCGPQPLSNAGGFIWQARVDVTCSGGGGGTHCSCNSQVWKAARDVPGAACSHPAWVEPCRWAQGAWHTLALGELILAQRSLGCFHPVLPEHLSPSSCHSQQLTPACRSGPAALLGVLQALPVLISLRNSDANTLQALQRGASSWD